MCVRCWVGCTPAHRWGLRGAGNPAEGDARSRTSHASPIRYPVGPCGGPWSGGERNPASAAVHFGASECEEPDTRRISTPHQSHRPQLFCFGPCWECFNPWGWSSWTGGVEVDAEGGRGLHLVANASGAVLGSAPTSHCECSGGVVVQRGGVATGRVIVRHGGRRGGWNFCSPRDASRSERKFEFLT